MKKILFLIGIIAIAASSQLKAQVSFTGNTREVIDVEPAANTGLNHIYVLYTSQGVSMTYTATSAPDEVTWYQYAEQGGAYATEVSGIIRNGNVTTMTAVEAGKGYIIEEGTNRTYIWVTDYSTCRLQLSAATVDPESDCGTATLHVTGSGPDIVYYTINGGRRVLDRGITVTYNTLTWNEDETTWNETATTEDESSFKSAIAVPAPYCATTFTIAGDRFLQAWNEGLSVTTETYEPRAIQVETSAVQEERDNDNEQKTQGSNVLGGSAPVNITFTAYCTDAVTYKEWQVSENQEFDNLIMNFSQDEVEYTFNDAGTTYWRFYGANSDGSCEYIGETYTVSIGESVLECPNVFSPGSTEGVNDVWKVSYKSIIDFHCWIFNRWGIKVAEFTDPAGGWDGKYNGKLVSAGVYYYVIQATGSDGKKYKKSGDINIIRYKKREINAATDDPDL